MSLGFDDRTDGQALRDFDSERESVTTMNPSSASAHFAVFLANSNAFNPSPPYPDAINMGTASVDEQLWQTIMECHDVTPTMTRMDPLLQRPPNAENGPGSLSNNPIKRAWVFPPPQGTLPFATSLHFHKESRRTVNHELTNLPYTIESSMELQHVADQDTGGTFPSSEEEPLKSPPIKTQVSNMTASSTRWEKWNNPSHAVDKGELPNYQKVEQRRQRNRLAMQRSRQRMRDNLQNLKAIVATLEKQYSELCLQSVDQSDGINQALLDQSAGNANRNMTTTSTSLEASHGNILALIKQYAAEKLFYQQSIHEYTQWKLRLEDILNKTTCLDNTATNQGSSAQVSVSEQQEAVSIFPFRPLRDEDVKEMILESTQEIRRIYNCITTADSSMLLDQLHVLGWMARRRANGNAVEFLYTKRFKNVSVHDIMVRTWESHKHLKSLQKVDVNTRRLDILQQVNNNAVVLGRDLCFRDDRSVFRTVFLQYRMETASEFTDPENPFGPKLLADGYWIGFHSLNPDHPCYRIPLGENDNEIVQYAELTVGIELLNVTNTTSGEKVVEIRWTGRTNYSSAQHVQRSAADTLSILLRWELVNIAPAMNLVSLSPSEEKTASMNTQ